MFKTRDASNTKLEFNKEYIPGTYIEPEALAKMQLYVQECSDEVGWLCTATKDNEGDYIIHDAILFDQEVSATTTEITPEGLSNFAEKLLKQENGMEIWNNIRVWGHSHVNMGVSPSGQDNLQMDTFTESGHDWFIRIIANKQGDFKVDIFDFKNGLIYLDAPWYKMLTEQEEQINEQIKNYQESLKKLQNDRITKIESKIKEEIKEKVKKKAYNYTNNVYGHGGWAGYNYGHNNNFKTKTIFDTSKKNKRNEEKQYQDYWEDYQDIFSTDEEVLSYFTDDELLIFATCESEEHLEKALTTLGHCLDDFTLSDIIRIYQVAQDYYLDAINAI